MATAVVEERELLKSISWFVELREKPSCRAERLTDIDEIIPA